MIGFFVFTSMSVSSRGRDSKGATARSGLKKCLGKFGLLKTKPLNSPKCRPNKKAKSYDLASEIIRCCPPLSRGADSPAPAR